MKKLIYLLLFTCFVSSACAKSPLISIDTIKAKRSLYVIKFHNENLSISTTNYYGDPRNEISFKSAPDSVSAAVRQLLDVDYIFIVRFKGELMNLVDVFQAYKIPLKFQTLPVKVDDEIIDNPQTLLISKNQIDSVKIITLKGKSFINITPTKNPKFEKEKENWKKEGKILVN